MSAPISTKLHGETEDIGTKDEEVFRAFGQPPILDDVDIGEPPDGGSQAWTNVCCSCLLMFTVFGFQNGLGQLQTYYSEHQLAAYSTSAISWIPAIHSFLTYIGSLFAGRYFDSHGLTLLLRTGSSMIVISLVALAFCQEYYQIMLAHCMYGLGATMLYTPGISVTSHWFKKRRSSAMGLVICGAGLGGVLYPIMFRELFARLSFRNTCLIVAAINAALLAPTLFFMKTRLPPRSLRSLRQVATAFKEVRYLCFFIGLFIVMINLFVPFFFAPTLATSNGLPAPLPSYSIAILQTGAFFGRVACGYLADWLGIWRIFTTCGVGSAIIVLALWIPKLNTGGTIFALLSFGAVGAAWVALASASCASISKPEEIGGRLGMMWSLGAFAILAGPPIAGELVKMDNGGFTSAGIFCGASYLLGSFIIVLPTVLGRFGYSREYIGR